MNYFFGLLALLGFLLSLAAHIAALSGVDVATAVPFIWALHVGIFVVFLPFLISSRKAYGKKPSWKQIRDGFPAWVNILGAVVLVYVIINFMLFIRATEGGNPSMQDGRFILEQHGHFIREISAAEYTSFRANEVRGFSGHWIFFYLADSTSKCNGRFSSIVTAP